MSLVDQAGSRVTSKSFVIFSMCLYERAEWILAVRMASSCIACYIFHIISIPFNCSDTALRVAEAMIVAKVKIFVSPCLLCFSNLGPELVLSQKPCLNFSHEPKAKFISITGPAWSTKLMWRGPKKEKKNSASYEIESWAQHLPFDHFKFICFVVAIVFSLKLVTKKPDLQ